MKCEFCGDDLSKVLVNDGAWEEGYCSKIHRKDHEKQLILNGEMDGIEGIFGIAKDSQYRDIAGAPIWFPKDGCPYYDRSLKRTFYSKKEKCAYLKEKRLVMTGDDSPKRWPIEAGDLRSREYRRRMRLED